jgi:hypothetical protein
VSLSILQDARLYEVLHQYDVELAQGARTSGCRHCGGVLHSARYPRKPRGGPAGLTRQVEKRLSFCCAREGCRRRRTPPSILFLGRRVYFGVVIVLLTAMTHGVTPRRAAELRGHLGVDRRTLARWRQWWREHFPASRFWREHRARFSPSVCSDGLPGTLLGRFAPQGKQDGIVSLLRFLAPIGSP